MTIIFRWQLVSNPPRVLNILTKQTVVKNLDMLLTFRRALFYYNDRSWRSFSNVLTEKLL